MLMNGSFLCEMNVLVVNRIVVDRLLVIAPRNYGGVYDTLGDCQQLFFQQPSAVLPNLVFFCFPFRADVHPVGQ